MARDDLAIMLARQVLGVEDYSRNGDHLVPTEVSSANAEVEINLRSMVHQMRQRIWISSAAIAQRVEAQLIEASSIVSVERVVATAVADEMQRVQREIADIVRLKISKAIDSAIAAHLGDMPLKLAKHVVRKMWKEIVG